MNFWFYRLPYFLERYSFFPKGFVKIANVLLGELAQSLLSLFSICTLNASHIYLSDK